MGIRNEVILKRLTPGQALTGKPADGCCGQFESSLSGQFYGLAVGFVDVEERG